MKLKLEGEKQQQQQLKSVHVGLSESWTLMGDDNRKNILPWS